MYLAIQPSLHLNIMFCFSFYLQMRRTLIIFFAILALATFATHVSADDYDYEDYEDYDYEDGDYEECNSWESDWSSNQRWVGGTSAGTKSASSVAKCGDLCIESDDCYTFNFFKGYVVFASVNRVSLEDS
jgi:hypothetical protein